MKHLYWLLLFTSINITARSQNWQTVYSDRTTYFDDSRQAIKIVYKSVDSAGDSTFKNYPCYFIDSLGNDITHDWGTHLFKLYDSSSWVGKKIVVKNNGTTIFYNDRNEKFSINTIALKGDTFTFIDNKSILIKAYCSDIFLADTFGIKDSAKRYRFIYNLKPGMEGKLNVPKLKDFEIILSKHYGLLKVPVFNNIWFSADTIEMYGQPFNYAAKNYFTNYYFNNLNVGDEYEYQISDRSVYGFSQNQRIYYRKVEEKTSVINTDTVVYKILCKNYWKQNFKGPPVSNVVIDTIYYVIQKRVQNNLPYKDLLPNQLITDMRMFSEFYMADTCNLSIYTRTDGFEYSSGYDYHSKVGAFFWDTDGSIGAPTPGGQEYFIRYKNFCNAEVGTAWAKYNVWPYSVNELEKATISLYPNPAFQSITVQGEGIQSSEIYDLSGRKWDVITAYDTVGNLTIDAASLNAGIYVVLVISEHGFSTHKVIISK